MNFVATKQPVPHQGVAPDDFLNALVDFGRTAPDNVFAPSPRFDIYSALHTPLAPGGWVSLPQRRAGMLEGLRILAAEESGWNWNCGVDTTNQRSQEKIECRETGIFQVSANSMNLDASLKTYIKNYLGTTDNQTFINAMKSDHKLAIEYCARLLRINLKWDGPIERGVVAQLVRPAAMAEFLRLLT
jgi:hypothetical protein